MKTVTRALLAILLATLPACMDLYPYDGEVDHLNSQTTHPSNDQTDQPCCETAEPPSDPVTQEGICADQRTALLSATAEELYEKATTGGIGNCSIQDASACETCACSAYVKISAAKWSQRGWPLNPASQDSTGCVSQFCYGGYLPDMCTCDLTKNAIAQIRNALNHPEDVCGLCDPDRAITVEMILGDY